MATLGPMDMTRRAPGRCGRRRRRSIRDHRHRASGDRMRPGLALACELREPDRERERCGYGRLGEPPQAPDAYVAAGRGVSVAARIHARMIGSNPPCRNIAPMRMLSRSRAARSEPLESIALEREPADEPSCRPRRPRRLPWQEPRRLRPVKRSSRDDPAVKAVLDAQLAVHRPNKDPVAARAAPRVTRRSAIYEQIAARRVTHELDASRAGRTRTSLMLPGQDVLEPQRSVSAT